jgi:hypothetical protein
MPHALPKAQAPYSRQSRSLAIAPALTQPRKCSLHPLGIFHELAKLLILCARERGKRCPVGLARDAGLHVRRALRLGPRHTRASFSYALALFAFLSFTDCNGEGFPDQDLEPIFFIKAINRIYRALRLGRFVTEVDQCRHRIVHQRNFNSMPVR